MRGKLRRLFLNRFFLVPAIIAGAVGGWNVYIASHADGIVMGWVVDSLGRAVPGATVRMMEQNFTTNSQRGVTQTDTNGVFRFDDNRSHSIQLRAEKDGMGRSPQRVVRLYFRSQHVEVRQPLVLDAGAR